MRNGVRKENKNKKKEQEKNQWHISKSTRKNSTNISTFIALITKTKFGERKCAIDGLN